MRHSIFFGAIVYYVIVVLLVLYLFIFLFNKDSVDIHTYIFFLVSISDILFYASFLWSMNISLVKPEN